MAGGGWRVRFGWGRAAARVGGCVCGPAAPAAPAAPAGPSAPVAPVAPAGPLAPAARGGGGSPLTLATLSPHWRHTPVTRGTLSPHPRRSVESQFRPPELSRNASRGHPRNSAATLRADAPRELSRNASRGRPRELSRNASRGRPRELRGHQPPARPPAPHLPGPDQAPRQILRGHGDGPGRTYVLANLCRPLTRPLRPAPHRFSDALSSPDMLGPVAVQHFRGGGVSCRPGATRSRHATPASLPAHDETRWVRHDQVT